MRITVASDARGASGAADYARLLGDALERLGHRIVPVGEGADVAVYNYAPYAAGVRFGWLRGMLSAHRLHRRSRHLVIVFHEVFVRPDDRLRMRIFEMLQRSAARRLDYLAAASIVADEARAQRLLALVPDAKRPVVVPVGPNIPVPDGQQRSSAATVVLFGLLHPDRDLETVVRATALLVQRVPSLRLRIVGYLGGDPGREARLRRLIDEVGAPATLEGLLDAKQVARVFAESTVFVSTYVHSVSLGSGTVAAALAYSLPVVVYEEAALHEALVPGSTVLTAPREPVQLAEVIALAIGETGATIGAQGRHLFERELAWAVIAGRFVELLQDLDPG